MLPSTTVLLTSRHAFRELAYRVADRLRAGDCLLLEGELGTGKTTWVDDMVSRWGCPGVVSSPTFQLVHHYPTPIPVYHMDFYRIKEASASVLDLEYYLQKKGILLIEWGQNLAHFLPKKCLQVTLSYGQDPDHRLVTIAGFENQERILYDPI